MPRDAAALLAETVEALDAIEDVSSWSEAQQALSDLVGLYELTDLTDEELADVVGEWNGHAPPCSGSPACVVAHLAHEHACFLLAAAAVGDRCDAHREALRDIAVHAGTILTADDVDAAEEGDDVDA